MIACIMTIIGRDETAARLARSLYHVKTVSRVCLSIDRDRNGCWWNYRECLSQIVQSGLPGLVFNDDVKLRATALDSALPQLLPYLGDHGLISLFTPPRKEYDDARARGYHAVSHYDLMWPQITLVSPDFALAVIEDDRLMDQAKVKYHDEVRFRFAAQRRKVPMLTMLGSYGTHDLSYKSALGTPAKIGSVVRDTRLFAEAGQDLSDMAILRRAHHTRDVQEYAA